MHTIFDVNPRPFVIGANLPWRQYGIDFGANAWSPNGGVGESGVAGQLDPTFAALASAGIRYVRWFLFCDGRAGVQYTDRGRPIGLDRFVFRDVDAALAAAQRHGVQIMFVVLDFLWCSPGSVLRGVQMGGRAHVLDDCDTREALLDSVLRPMFERYARDPEIFAWDIINEPEWIKTVGRTPMRAYLAEAIALAHATTRQPVTVGSAGVRWRDRYDGLDLDFYQVHWYDSLKHQPPLETPVDDLGFDRPVLLGEFPSRGSRRSSAEIVDAARQAGYAGAFYWSVLSKDECSA